MGELVTGLYVFQSIMVPCTLGLRERTLPVVLESNAPRANHFSVDRLGSSVGSNRRCVLPKWHVTACPVDGRFDGILEGLADRLIAIHGADSTSSARHVVYISVFVVALLPTFISREIIFGSPFRSGYQVEQFAWRSPALWNVLFSWDHGLLSWTPILMLALIGLGIFCW